MQAILFSGGSRGCTARDVCRLSPNHCSRNGSAQARAQVCSVAMLLDLLPVGLEQFDGGCLANVGCGGKACSQHFAPFASCLSEAGLHLVLEMRRLEIHQSWQVTQALCDGSVPGRERKFSLESAEGSHRSRMPSGSWKSMRPHQKVWFDLLYCL